MLNEKKGTCCHKCGHVHVKGTKCPSPFLKGERSCARRSLKEAEQTDHYQDRKKERGTILDITVPDYAYAGKSADEVKAKLIPALQAKLDKRLKEVENADLGVSNNANLGLIIFVPELQYKERFVQIEMVCGDGTGYHYLAITANNKLITMYPSELEGDALIEEIKRHVKEHRPGDTRPAKARKLSGSTFKIDIDGKEVKEKEEKPKDEKVPERDVPADYRPGKTYTFTNEKGKEVTGKIIKASNSGRGGADGKVDWIEVEYKAVERDPVDRTKAREVRKTRRFENLITAAYFKKTLKKELHTMDHHAADSHHQVRADIEEMSLSIPSVDAFIKTLEANPQYVPELVAYFNFADKAGIDDIKAHLEDIDYADPDWKEMQDWLQSKISDKPQSALEEALKGLWANIRAKRARGEKPARKGSEAYNKAVQSAKRINAMDETEEYCPSCLAEYLLEYENKIEEAEYRGRKVQLGKPFLTPGGPKKRSVYVKNAKGNVVKVNFGDPNLKIKKNIPARRKSFRARHKCNTAKDRTTPRYWSCKAW